MASSFSCVSKQQPGCHVLFQLLNFLKLNGCDFHSAGPLASILSCVAPENVHLNFNGGVKNSFTLRFTYFWHTFPFICPSASRYWLQIVHECAALATCCMPHATCYMPQEYVLSSFYIKGYGYQNGPRDNMDIVSSYFIIIPQN